MAVESDPEPLMATRVLRIESIQPPSELNVDLGEWFATNKCKTPKESENMVKAAEALRVSSVPVAFPTETVYGLGADATRSSAVLGIYKAKRRPADNPLIVHVSSLDQLRHLLQPAAEALRNGHSNTEEEIEDPIPSIYYPLITRFWPGPLTVLLPNPPHSPLAPEVTSGLPTFGCRIPSSPLARLLIHLSDRPLAAPSANASTRPSPTTAQHVLDDLSGRIELILDGGPCNVGVESTVVDGLTSPPAILRPGGVGIEEIRSCGGAWSNVIKAYKDKEESTSSSRTLASLPNGTTNGVVTTPGPRAPGMKYKHYSPRARVLLFETNTTDPSLPLSHARRLAISGTQTSPDGTIGIIRTRTWPKDLGLNGCSLRVEDISLGADLEGIARGLFRALRELDERGVGVIFIEGVDDAAGGLAAAVMNRLRKASEVDVK